MAVEVIKIDIPIPSTAWMTNDKMMNDIFSGTIPKVLKKSKNIIKM